MILSRIVKFSILSLVMGMVYTNIELVTRAIECGLVGWNGVKNYSLVGWTSLWMIPIGGVTAWILGMLNEIPLTRTWKLWQISLLGMVLIFLVEFLSGLLCNKLLQMAIWEYKTFDILGQISLTFALPWFLLVPFILWLDDLIRFYMFGEQRPAPLLRYYHFLQPVPRDDEYIHSGN